MLIFSLSSTLKHRVSSIVTSVSAEDERGSTGNRIELWKGALIIFKKSPLLGTGIGDFTADINELIAAGEIKKVPVTDHAHNIFLQSLATQGIVGLLILLSLFTILLWWSVHEIKDHGIPGGYIIMMSTLLTLLEGLTENNIGISKFIAAYCLTIGLLGKSRFKKEGGNA
jgi:O-antigen ligase